MKLDLPLAARLNLKSASRPLAKSACAVKAELRFKFTGILKFRAADKFRKLIKNSILREGGHIGLHVLICADKCLDFAILDAKAAAERLVCIHRRV